MGGVIQQQPCRQRLSARPCCRATTRSSKMSRAQLEQHGVPLQAGWELCLLLVVRCLCCHPHVTYFYAPRGLEA